MKLSRRDLIRTGAGALMASHLRAATQTGVEVNDIHSQLNSTNVARIVRPESIDDLRAAILAGRSEGLHVS